MNSSIALRTVTVAAAALLTIPGAALAQTPPTTPPATAQPTPAPQDRAQSAATPSAAQEHLRQAKAALNDVATANLNAKAKAQVADLKKRVSTLERSVAESASATGAASPSPKAASGKVNWGAEVAAIDKTLTALLGTDTPATGTSGTTPAPGNKASDAVTLDEASRAKLTEFRTHITAFAVAMSGQQPPAADAAAPASAAPTSDPAQPPATTQPPAAAPPATAQPPATEPPAAAQTPAAPAVQVDEEATRRHLTGARNALSELTQLPAASQLTGDARTQVSQLITNFNELISTKTEWRGAYAKVAANLMALLGPDTGTPDPSSGSGTPGAVGTSGAGMNLDAGIRGKLVEMRRQLAEFEKAAGGTGGAAPTAGEAQPPAAPAASPTPAAPAASPTPAAPATSPTPAAPATTPAPSASPSAPDSAQSPAGDALAHLAAIESLMKMQNEGGGVTFDKAQVELLRTHLAELRRILEKK